VRSLIAAVVAALVALALAPAAGAADRIYWTSFDSGKVEWANLDGSGGTHELNATGATISTQGYGMGGAIDPIGQRYYWANQQNGKINWANLDGSGGGDLPTGSATVSGPDGISVDPIGRRVYWSNGNKISYANLDGSGGGDLATGGASVSSAHGTTVYPALSRIYWTNWNFIGDGSIAFAATDGSGGSTLPLFGTATIDTPFGLAIDAAAGRMYWVNDNPGIISVADLDGSDDADIDNRGLKMTGPYGIALDPESGRAYTANFAGNDLTYLGVDNSGGATVPVTLPKESGPNSPVLLKSPRSVSAPVIRATPEVVIADGRRPGRKGRKGKKFSFTRQVGLALSCARGGWAPDLVEARLYRAPVSTRIQWTRDGAPIPGATSELLRTAEVGTYGCRETAVNQAGAATGSSGLATFFKVGGVKLNRKKGTARLAVSLPPGGVLHVAGAGIVPQSVASGESSVLIKANGKKRRKLRKRGEVGATASLIFELPGAPPSSQSAYVLLKKRLPR
jgi:hypothetical protein